MGATTSPWTWGRVRYVASLAIPFFIQDPEKGNYLDSYARGLDFLGEAWVRGIDGVLLMQADLLITSQLLRFVLNQRPGCFITLHPRHDLFWLTPAHARKFRGLIEPFRVQGGPFFHEGQLEPAGIRQLQPSPVHSVQWTDVDYRQDFYRVTIGQQDEPSWMERYGQV